MTALDREDWSYQRCEYCARRRRQLTIDERPRDPQGKYLGACWQCYWRHELWRRGPIVNCGPMWDGADIRRGGQEQGG